MPESEDPRFPEGPTNEEIADRLQQIREDLHQMEGLPDLPDMGYKKLEVPETPSVDEFETRLEALKSKARDVHDRRERKQNEEQKQFEQTAEMNRGLGLGLTLAYTMMGVPVFCMGVGYVVGKITNNIFAIIIGAVVGIVLGLIGAVSISARYSKSE